MPIIDSIIQVFIAHWYITIPIILMLLVYFAYPRRIKYEGKQPTPDIIKRMFTDKVTGTTFVSTHLILGINKLSSRRKKFNKPVISVPLAIISTFSIFLLLIILLFY